jgi:hypothetical protein
MLVMTVARSTIAAGMPWRMRRFARLVRVAEMSDHATLVATVIIVVGTFDGCRARDFRA